MHRIALVVVLALEVISAPALAGKILVWADEAHTRRIEVDPLDPDEIADPSSLDLGLGHSFGNFGISIGFSRQKGVEYSKAKQELIEKIRDLCERFNDGELSLEAYQRELRAIFDAIERARLCRLELMVNSSIEAAQATARLDKALGLPPRDAAAYRRKMTAALDTFRSHVEAIPGPRTEETVEHVARITDEGTLDSSRRAVDEDLKSLKASLGSRPPRAGKTTWITIWKDHDRTEKVRVPQLEVDGLVDDLEQSLGIQIKYSAPLFSQYVGHAQTWTLDTKAHYGEAAQMLIVKYRRLCMEYNAGLVPQEDYADRLAALYEAERRAAAVRSTFAGVQAERMRAMVTAMQERMESPSPALEKGLEDLARQKSEAGDKLTGDKQPRPDLVEKMSREHREQMVARDISRFAEAVDEIPLGSAGEMIEVWVDEAHTRKIKATRLETDLIAQSVKMRLSLHISFFGIGPEIDWARDQGIDYGSVAQDLIIRSKQLCMDYNAGLVSQEGYDRRRREIDQAVEAGARFREALSDLLDALKGEAFKELDRQTDRLGGGGGG